MGCSTHVVPSWSKVAMRSSGATKLRLFLSVVVFTKSTMAFFAGPSFHDGRGSVAALAAGCTGFGVDGVALLVQLARIRTKKSDDSNAPRVFIPGFSWSLQHLPAYSCVPAASGTPAMKQTGSEGGRTSPVVGNSSP